MLPVVDDNSQRTATHSAVVEHTFKSLAWYIVMYQEVFRGFRLDGGQTGSQGQLLRSGVSDNVGEVKFF
jgi:hypothetical protein